MLSWTERPQGSPIEYENAQKRILEVFTQWKAPGNFKVELFVIRVGDWGGYMLLDCDDPTAVHKFCSMLPAFVFEARPVIPIEDAVRVELEAIAFRDGLNSGPRERHCRSLKSANKNPREHGSGDKIINRICNSDRP
jgi:muconolactone delta-isomerase